MGWIPTFALAFVAVTLADAAVGLLELPGIVDSLIGGITVACAFAFAERRGWIRVRRRGRPRLEPQAPVRND